MNQADLKKAQSLSKRVADLGLTSKKPAPIKFSYKEAPVPSDFSLQALIVPLVKQAMAELAPKEMEVTPELVKKVISVMHSLPENDKLEVSKGIRNASSFIYNKTKYGMHEMMHGGGPTLAAGSNITLTSNADGTTTVAAGSGALTFLTATGTINDVNVTFTFASLPLALIINSGIYQQAGGAITWSYLAGTVTLSSPVGNGGSIIGIS